MPPGKMNKHRTSGDFKIQSTWLKNVSNYVSSKTTWQFGQEETKSCSLMNNSLLATSKQNLFFGAHNNW